MKASKTSTRGFRKTVSAPKKQDVMYSVASHFE